MSRGPLGFRPPILVMPIIVVPALSRPTGESAAKETSRIDPDGYNEPSVARKHPAAPHNRLSSAASYPDPTAGPVTGERGKHAPKVRIRRNSPLVTRLVGLETEYATLVADNQNLTHDDLPTSHLVYSQICEAIRRDQPTVSGLFDSEQMFLASGGAVTFESHPSMYALPGGLVEIATPEVQSPDDLLACQRSIDELASDATADSETSFDLRILKNSSDALGHVYGCHENYEAEVASGIGLLVYRAFVLLMWGMQVISLMCSLPLMM
ncbi:MAG: proteasome accessory factor PafA2 family protein, partial [Rubripirellula sp.]